jgi:hypothetical protein
VKTLLRFVKNHFTGIVIYYICKAIVEVLKTGFHLELHFILIDECNLPILFLQILKIHAAEDVSGSNKYKGLMKISIVPMNST